MCVDSLVKVRVCVDNNKPWWAVQQTHSEARAAGLTTQGSAQYTTPPLPVTESGGTLTKEVKRIKVCTANFDHLY